MAVSVLGIFMTLVSSGLPLTTAKLTSKYIATNEYKNLFDICPVCGNKIHKEV
jgi:O-antigen/teichoic acid export membrane protein